MIEQYFSQPTSDSQTYNFSFITITENKKRDEQLITELQKKILTAYRSQRYLQRKRRNLNRNQLIDYINKKVIPRDKTNFDLAVRHGDFGEVFASLIIQYIEKKEFFNKLRWKYNNDKSVFGTDIVAFDNINNPTEIGYYEIKTRENALKKEEIEKVKVGKNNKSILDYITKIAYKSLENDMNSDKESILDFMSRWYEEKDDLEKSDLFSDIVDGVRTVNKIYSIYIITDIKITKKKYSILLSSLNSLPITINPLNVVFVFIEDIKGLIKETWSTIASNGADYIEANSL